MSNPGHEDSQRRRLVLLCVLVFLSRLLFAGVVLWRAGAAGFTAPDTITYTDPTQHLLHGSFSSNDNFPEPGGPELFRTPGYPLLLLPAMALHYPIAIAVFENCLLVFFLCWIMGKLLVEISPGSKALGWVIGLYAIEPSGLLHCEKVLSEIAFATFFLLFVWLFLRFLRDPRYSRLVVSVLVLGAATYIRPVTIYLGVWLVPILFYFPRTLVWNRRVLRAVLFPVLFALTLVPWILRNAVETGYASFSSSGPVNLYFYSGAALKGQLEHRSFSEELAAMGYNDTRHYFEVHPEQKDWPEAKIIRYWQTEANKLVGAHWRAYALIHARGCMQVVLNPGVSEVLGELGLSSGRDDTISARSHDGVVSGIRWYLSHHPIAAVLIPAMMVQLLLYYVFALVGLRRLPLQVKVLFGSLFVYFVLVSGFPAATARFRLPLMPLVCICAAVAIAGRKAKPSQTADEKSKAPANLRA